MITVMTDRDAGQWPLGDLFRQARERSGYSVREAAKAAGFSTTTWTSLETGTRLSRAGVRAPQRPRAENVIAAAEVVGVDVNEALKLAGYAARVHFEPMRGRPTVSQHALLQKIGQLTEVQRQAVSDVVNAMLDPEGGMTGSGDSPNGEIGVVVARDEATPKFVEERTADRARRD